MSAEVNAWDNIEVRAGSTGCVLDSRLAKDPACRAPLLDAGLPDRNPMIDMPPAMEQDLPVREDLNDGGLEGMACLDVPSDAPIIEASIATGQAGHHANGTCAMGHGEHAVVGSRLWLRAVNGLHVINLSVMPAMLLGHTNGSVLKVAWRASEQIVDDACMAV